MTCQYAHDPQTASFAFDVPAGLVVLSPSDQAVVTSSRQTVVTYRTVAGALPVVVALSPTAKAFARPEATTSPQATLETTVLHGVGTLALTQQIDSLPVRAPGFQGSSGRVQSMTVITVTWT